MHMKYPLLLHNTSIIALCRNMVNRFLLVQSGPFVSKTIYSCNNDRLDWKSEPSVVLDRIQ